MWYLILDMSVYENNFEYMFSEFNQIELFIEKYIKSRNEMSLESQREEAVKNYRYESLIMKTKLENSIKDDFFSAYYFKKVCEFNNLEWFVFLISVMYRVEKKYKDLILKIENENALTYSAVLKLYFFVENISEIKNYYSLLLDLKEKMNSLCFVDDSLKIDERVFQNIMSNAEEKIKIPGVDVVVPEKINDCKLPIREEIALKIYNFLKKTDIFDCNCVCINGEDGIGKNIILKRVIKLCDKALVTVNISNLKNENYEKTILTACREALFIGGFICFKGIVENETSMIYLALDIARKFSNIVFILSDKKINFIGKVNDIKFINIELSELSMEERFKSWKDELKNFKIDKKLDISELSSKFLLNPYQIKRSISYAANQGYFEGKSLIGNNEITQGIYAQMSDELSEKATLIKKKHQWDELILNSKEKNLIKRACNQLKYRKIVYDEWKMGNRILYGNGLSMLFAGPPGTGKTMAAQVVANELGLEVYRVDLSRVVSKYIGETEKNLGEIFDLAKKSNAILLFDETDAIFAKRTEVKDSHDRNANLETSYLLQKMEEHSGVSIMTTNFLENIDKAFFRRINYVVHFNLPSEKERKEIWKKIFSKEVPLSKDIDFNFISRQFEISGGSIKNVALTAAFIAASEKSKVDMKIMIKSLEYEIRKQGKMVSKDDFGEYGYLL